MTDSTKTLIAALLDRSGSMVGSKQATEDGWRDLIADQRGEPGECEVMLAQFDTEYEVLYPPTDIAAVPEFVVEPRGGTALLDATGRLITEVGRMLAAQPEDQRPGRVICLIMTDGCENSSREWNLDRVKTLITEQQKTYGWEFIFLGANIDAVGVAVAMGMDRRKAMMFDDKSYRANMEAYALTSAVMKEARAGRDFGFSQADRDAAMGEEDRPA